MRARNLRQEFRELHKRKPGSVYFASEDTGRAIAYLIAPLDRLSTPDPEDLFLRWRSGGMQFRMYSILIASKDLCLEQRARNA